MDEEVALALYLSLFRCVYVCHIDSKFVYFFLPNSSKLSVFFSRDLVFFQDFGLKPSL